MHKIRPLSAGIALFLLFIFLFFDRQPALADCRSFDSLLRAGGFGVADSRGRIISSCNQDLPFVPASTVKIVTALAAFRILGDDYRFATEFFLDDAQNLFIRGHGDPFLVSEEVSLIASEIKARGIAHIRSVFVDNSLYDSLGEVPGQGVSANPYDAPVAAVAVNFNTVSIAVGADGLTNSAEPQTPTLPIMQDLARGLSPGEYRLNICRGGCDVRKRSARYTAELFRAKLEERGVAVGPGFGLKAVPNNARHLYTHLNTRKLEEVVFSFLKFSSNFVANQVYLACGIKLKGNPASWEKSSLAMSSVLAQVLEPNTLSAIRVVDGAGLSRDNRLTVRALLQILIAFKPHMSLLQEKMDASLKSGTLKGVYNYAGYLANGYPFVILLNQRQNTRDSILERLENMHGSILGDQAHGS